MSLEVGEHIPSAFEHTLFENLHLNNECGVILSWAIPGQARAPARARWWFWEEGDSPALCAVISQLCSSCT